MRNNTLFIFCILWLIKLVGCQTLVSCNNTANFTIPSAFATNRDLLLRSLPSKVSSNATPGNYFYTTSVGEGPDKVYGHAMCLADYTSQHCSDLLTEAIQQLVSTCPNQKEALSISSYPIRYANRPIKGELLLEPTRAGSNTVDIEPNNTVSFHQSWYKLMDQVTEGAAVQPVVKCAIGVANSTGNHTIYVRMHCFADLSPSQCTFCLREAVNYYQGQYHGKIGGYAQKPGCWFRWDLFPFFNSSCCFNATALPLPTTTTDKGDGRSKTLVTIVSVVLSFLVVVNLLYILYHRKKTAKLIQHGKDEDISILESLRFDIETLQIATANFSQDNKLGEGGFGAVYKGKLLNGRDIAVKRWSKNSAQGNVQFENEVVLLAKLQHRNLVRLIGYCFQDTERLLVYEFIANKSLDCYIFDNERRLLLDWNNRYKIIEGIARGILYLHQDSRIQIIHRDLKPSNVLLDDQMNPKISDFGTAKLFEVDQSQVSTHRIVGTYGYMSPEYAMHGQISIKTDVFSFGVLVLEIISSQKVSQFGYGEDENLLTYAWRNWDEGVPQNLIDKVAMGKNGATQEMIRCIQIGLLCVQEDMAKRPTMASVVLMLSSRSVSLPPPLKPAYYMTTFNSDAQPSFDLHFTTTTETQSLNQISISDQGPR